MKLAGCILALAAVSSAIPLTSEQSAASLPKTFVINTAGATDVAYPHLYYANNSLFIGNIRYEIYSEPFVAWGARNTINFLSIHFQPLRTQSLYIHRYDSLPVSFTNPGTLGLPEGGIGFTIDSTTGPTKNSTSASLGYTTHSTTNSTGALLLSFQHEQAWKACPVNTKWGHTYQLYWDGKRSLQDCVNLVLTVEEVEDCRPL